MRATAVFLAFAITFVAASGKPHDCERACVPGDIRTCRYTFQIVEYHTMSRACYDCSHNPSDCERPECVAADGVNRTVLTVNRQLPGPAIQVCEGDRVIVDVHNDQVSDTETIHWHGQHMKDYQYYDGVPFITQCPIIGDFRYDFPANTVGTHWWHSHAGVHRGEGIFGALIVREVEDPLRGHYDFDSRDHVLVLHDWVHDTTEDIFFRYHHKGPPNSPDAILINGKGRKFDANPNGPEVTKTPMEVLQVIQGRRYRIRLISASSYVCPMIVSIDGHKMTVIATDGAEVVPFQVSSLEITSGERFDIVVEANQAIGNYWIRINGLLGCNRHRVKQGAVLRYLGAPEELPREPLDHDTDPQGIILNPHAPTFDHNEVTWDEVDSIVPSPVPQTVSRQFHLFLHRSEVNNTYMYNPKLYPFNAVDGGSRVQTPQINGISFKAPSSPPLSQPKSFTPRVCHYGREVPKEFCVTDFCECTYVLESALGDAVEMVLVGDGLHPFHLHGYTFHVVAMGFLGSGTTMQDVINLDNSGGIKRKLQKAVLKDTVLVPGGGYVIIRFKADNPGWWLMHCHFLYHSDMGMTAVLHVGGVADLPEVPPGFPTCGTFNTQTL